MEQPTQIPPAPSTCAADHGLRAAADWAAIAQELQGLNVISDERQRRLLSKDFHWYSPILAGQLAGCVADLVVKPSTEAEVQHIAAVAARHRVPLTVRGAGTGNYGQCVPLVGGLVLDCSEMMRVLDIQPGRVTVQAGARLLDIELAVRETGQALRMWPSTWQVATIAGFVAGGFGGVGSTAHGVLRDSSNLLRCRVVSVEADPKVIELFGTEIQQVHHAYGSNGIITELEVALSPAVAWMHVIALFPDYGEMLACATAAQDAAAMTAQPSFLLSAVDARFAPFYTALRAYFNGGRHALFAMIAPQAMDAFCHLVALHGGTVTLAMNEAELQAAGLPPASECAYNHTTLQVLKADRSWTYLQVAYPSLQTAVVLRQMARWGDEVWQHQEFAMMNGAPATFAILLVRWTGVQRQYELMREIEADGCTVFNPHVISIEDGGMKTIDSAQIEFKKRADPMGLMNPGKTRGWSPDMARGS